MYSIYLCVNQHNFNEYYLFIYMITTSTIPGSATRYRTVPSPTVIAPPGYSLCVSIIRTVRTSCIILLYRYCSLKFFLSFSHFASLSRVFEFSRKLVRTCTYDSYSTYRMIYFLYVQLDRVMISLEVMLRSSAPQAMPTTLRAFSDSPG